MPKIDKRDDITAVRDQITDEVTADAEQVARDVFRHDGPDIKTMGSEDLENLYRSKWEAEDRAWLQKEARRDPRQFMRMAKKLGVSVQPQPNIPPGATPEGLLQMALSSPPPMAGGAMTPSPGNGLLPGGLPGVVPPPSVPISLPGAPPQQNIPIGPV